jgi:hypothetical protein
VCYRETGRFDESAALLVDTLRRLERTLGRDHPSTKKCSDGLATTRYRQFGFFMP